MISNHKKPSLISQFNEMVEKEQISFEAATQILLMKKLTEIENENKENKIEKNKGFKSLFSPKKIAPNVLKDFIKELQSQDLNKNQNRIDNFINILQKFKNQFPESEVKTLLLHIITQTSGIYCNNRNSNLISPSPKENVQANKTYQEGQKWKIKFADILIRKNFKFNPFGKKNIKFNDPIEKHVAWIFSEIYSRAYPNVPTFDEQGGITRYVHGIQHVTRVALYVRVFVNLYRKFGDEDAKHLSEEEIKLLQLAALFHDAAREGEEEDKWDHESAIFLYFYLTKTLNLEKSKAKAMAEAIANKDINKNGYFAISEDPNGEIEWVWRDKIQEKNIYQKIIHDPDSLDIIRARDAFDAQYLDFYSDFILQKDNKEAFETMALLITEARSLIEIQGDTVHRRKNHIKDNYENQEAYSACLKSIDNNLHPILHQLSKEIYTPEELSKMSFVADVSYDPKKGLEDEKNVQAAMREGLIFARGVGAPSAIEKKDKTKETLAEVEFRKMHRELGVGTTSSKENKEKKEGNPARSVTILGYGCGVYSNAGFLMVNPNRDLISAVSSIDLGSGRGKKTTVKDKPKMTKEEVTISLQKVHDKMKMGGSSVKLKNWDQALSHVEILTDIRKVDAIYVTKDPNIHNTILYEAKKGKKLNPAANRLNPHKTREYFHEFSPILEAIYLRKLYEKKYDDLKKERMDYYIKKFGRENAEAKFKEIHGERYLPIFIYSGIHNTIHRVNENDLTEEKIIELWKKLCGDFIRKKLDFNKKHLNDNFIFSLKNMSIEDIKTLSLYGTKKNSHAHENAPADFYLPNLNEILRKEINQIIAEKEAEVKNAILEAHVISDQMIINITKLPNLLKDPDVIEKLKSLTNTYFDDVKTSLFEETPIKFWKNFPWVPKNYVVDKKDNLKILFESTEFKLFYLFSELNLIDKKEFLQNQAILSFSKSVDKLNKISISERKKRIDNNQIEFDQLDNFFKLYAFSIAFKIDQNPLVKNKLEKLLKNEFDMELYKLDRECSTRNISCLKSIIDDIKNFNSSLNKDEISKISVIYTQKWQEVLKIKNKASHMGVTLDDLPKIMDQLIKLGEVCHLTHKIPKKEEILSHLNELSIHGSNVSNVISLITKFSNPSTDLEAFKFIINHLSGRKDLFLDEQEDIIGFFANLKFFHTRYQITYQDTFKPEQFMLIENRVNEICNSLLKNWGSSKLSATRKLEKILDELATFTYTDLLGAPPKVLTVELEKVLENEEAKNKLINTEELNKTFHLLLQKYPNSFTSELQQKILSQMPFKV